MQTAQMAMMDMQHLSEQLKPSAEAPDTPVSTFAVIKGLATCPSMKQIDDVTPGDTKVIVETVDKLEEALGGAGALDAEARRVCAELTRPHRRNVALLYWQMYQSKLEGELKLDNITERQQQICNQIGTGILVKAQMLLVQNRDEQCIKQMTSVLESDGLPFPKLRLEAACSPKDKPGEKEVLGDGVIKLDVVLHRDHASEKAVKPSIADSPLNPQGILEAYWCYAEGVKPEASTPNSLIGAQPMVVKALDEPFASLELSFRAPPTPGTYPIKVHVISTSVIGVDLTADTTFTVVEDDLPPLE